MDPIYLFRIYISSEGFKSRNTGLIVYSVLDHFTCSVIVKSLNDFYSVRSLAVRSGLTPRSKREFISSDAVDKDQLTPALQQYFRFKEQYKGKYARIYQFVDYVLFFRLGDFYEFFFEDAIMISQILGIALTTRGKYQSRCSYG